MSFINYRIANCKGEFVLYGKNIIKVLGNSKKIARKTLGNVYMDHAKIQMNIWQQSKFKVKSQLALYRQRHTSFIQTSLFFQRNIYTYNSNQKLHLIWLTRPQNLGSTFGPFTALFRAVIWPLRINQDIILPAKYFPYLIRGQEIWIQHGNYIYAVMLSIPQVLVCL